MEWAQVINNPFLKNLPFKIELNKWGKILMSPASNNHGRLQYEVGALIDKNMGSGKIIIECSIETSDGTWCQVLQSCNSRIKYWIARLGAVLY